MRSSTRKIFLSSAYLSALAIFDRIVMYVIPLYFWGVNESALWVTVRTTMFLMLAAEGGAGQQISKKVNLLKKTKSYHEKCKGLKLYFLKSQFIWWLIVTACSSLVVFIFYLEAERFVIDLNFFIVLILYALIYYYCQLGMYYMLGVGLISQGYNAVNFAKLLEICALITLPVMGGGAFSCLMVMLLIRFIFLVFFGGVFVRGFHLRELFFSNGSSYLKLGEYGIKSRYSYFLFPLIPAVYNFSPILILNFLATPTILMNFMVARLFGRLNFQLSQFFHRAVWPILNRSDKGKIYLKYGFLIYSIFSVFSLFIVSFFFLLYDDVDFFGLILEFELIVVIMLTSIIYGVVDLLVSKLMSAEKHGFVLSVRCLLYLFPLFSCIFMSDITAIYCAYIFLFSEIIILMITYLRSKYAC